MKMVFIGSGFMARAMIRGITESETLRGEDILVVNPADPAGRDEVCAEYGVTAAQGGDIASADCVFFAVKPQTFPEVCEQFGEYFTPDKIYLTIMAGVPTKTVSEAAHGAPVVRFMPNLALSVKKSATAFCLGEGAGERERELALRLFAPLGEIRELPESQMSEVTALSGSGPAYFYYLCEAMIEAAVADGMDPDTAKALAVQTFIGTAKLIEDAGESPTEMRRRITSKKGTTEAGIGAMGDAGFFAAVDAGYRAARDRSEELSKLF